MDKYDLLMNCSQECQSTSLYQRLATYFEPLLPHLFVTPTFSDDMLDEFIPTASNSMETGQPTLQFPMDEETVMTTPRSPTTAPPTNPDIYEAQRNAQFAGPVPTKEEIMALLPKEPVKFTATALPKACPPDALVTAITATDTEGITYPEASSYDFQLSKKKRVDRTLDVYFVGIRDMYQRQWSFVIPAPPCFVTFTAGYKDEEPNTEHFYVLCTETVRDLWILHRSLSSVIMWKPCLTC